MKLEPLGDTAVVATLGSDIGPETLGSVLRCARAITARRGRGILDVVPAYATVTVFYDPALFAESATDAYDSVCRFVRACCADPEAPESEPPAAAVEIPVCYGGSHGPDLGLVAEAAGMTAAAAAALHSGADYLVHAIGFTPGFPYLGGLPQALHSPRRETPRTRVNAGSVGIGAGQTGVYPVASLALFRPQARPPSLLKPGDRVRFRAITGAEFSSWT
jgi:inhibitor of KinA